MTDNLAAAMARLRRDATHIVAVASCRDLDCAESAQRQSDLMLVCEACEQQAARLCTYGCKNHVSGPAVYCPTCGIPRAHVSGTVPLTYAEQAQEIAILQAQLTSSGPDPRVVALDAHCRQQAQEIAQLHDYASLLERGFGSHEARESVWPTEHTKVDFLTPDVERLAAVCAALHAKCEQQAQKITALTDNTQRWQNDARKWRVALDEAEQTCRARAASLRARVSSRTTPSLVARAVEADTCAGLIARLKEPS